MMIKRIVNRTFPVLAGLVLLFSCGKDAGDPTMYFIEGEGFISSDTMLMVGDSAKVGVFMEWNGLDDLESLEVEVNGNLMGNSYVEQNRGEYAFHLIKNDSESEEWTFTLTDSKNHQVTKKILFTKDPNSIYGGVVAINNVILGSQANPVKPGFLALQGPTLYDLQSAAIHQDEVDMLLYYDEGDSGMTLAAPAAEIPAGIFESGKGPISWDTRNRTLFMLSDYQPDDFVRFVHDGFFITVFDDNLAADQASQLEADQVYLFRTESGRLGSILINSISSSVDGEVDFSIILQKQ